MTPSRRSKHWCRTGKMTYLNDTAALIALVQISLVPEYAANPEHTPQRFYRCPFCAYYHLTSQVPRATL